MLINGATREEYEWDKEERQTESQSGTEMRVKEDSWGIKERERGIVRGTVN